MIKDGNYVEDTSGVMAPTYSLLQKASELLSQASIDLRDAERAEIKGRDLITTSNALRKSAQQRFDLAEEILNKARA